MILLEELIKILNKRQCKCFSINTETLTIICNNDDTHCSHLNSSISEITGFLLLNNIEYLMNEKREIKLLINHNELKQPNNKDFKFHNIINFNKCKY